MAGRKSKLADPEFLENFSSLYASGMSHTDIAAELGVHPSSITNWVKDPRAVVVIGNLIKERVNRITRKIDASIEARLADAEEWDLDDLVKVRREMIRSMPDGKIVSDTASAASEISEAMDQSPDLAKALQELVEGRAATPAA